MWIGLCAVELFAEPEDGSPKFQDHEDIAISVVDVSVNVTELSAIAGCGKTVNPACGATLPGMSARSCAGALRCSYWSRVQIEMHQRPPTWNGMRIASVVAVTDVRLSNGTADGAAGHVSPRAQAISWPTAALCVAGCQLSCAENSLAATIGSRGAGRGDAVATKRRVAGFGLSRPKLS